MAAVIILSVLLAVILGKYGYIILQPRLPNLLKILFLKDVFFGHGFGFGFMVLVLCFMILVLALWSK